VSLLKQWVNGQINDKMVNISDPWYTGDFTKAYDDILEGCQSILKQI